MVIADSLLQEKFLACLFHPGDTINLRLITNSKGDGAINKFVYFSEKAAEEIKEIINQYNATHNIYFGVHPRQGEKNKTIDCIRSAFVDIDAKDFSDQSEYENHVKETLDKLASVGFSPSMRVDSGHGIHLYWLLKKSVKLGITLDEADIQQCPDWRNLQEALILFCKGDHCIKDLPRILRLPETANIKNPDKPVMCKIISADDKMVYPFSAATGIFKPYEKLKKAQEKERFKAHRYYKEKLTGHEKPILEVIAATRGICDNYDDWFRIALACKAQGFSYPEIDFIFANSAGYNFVVNQKIYDRMKPRSIGFGTVYWYAKTKNPELLKEKLREIQGEPYKKKGDIVEIDGKTFIIKEDKFKELYPVELANFTMRINTRIFDDDNNENWKITLTLFSQEKEITLVGNDFLILRDFQKALTAKGLYLLHITDTQIFHSFIKHVYDSSAITKAKKTQYIGRGKNSVFVFSNGFASAGSVEPLKNIIVEKSKIKIFMPENPKEFLRNIIIEMHEIYGDEAWKLVGFPVATLFSPEIIKKKNCFPHLFLNGPAKCGKSTCFTLQLALFGAATELTPFNFSSTTVAWNRTAHKIRAIPLVLNEYQSTKKNNGTLQQLFDREGRQQGKFTNDMQTLKYEVNATFIIASTRNITGYESDAVNSRLITVELGADNHSLQNKKIIQSWRAKQKYFSCFVPISLQINSKKLVEEIEQESFEIASKIDTDFRLNESYAMTKMCANAQYDNLDLPQFKVGDITHCIAKQAEQISEASITAFFIDTLISLIEKGDMPNNLAVLDYSDGAETLIFVFKSTYPFVRRFLASAYDKEILPDVRTLSKLLCQECLYKTTRRLPDRPKKAYHILTGRETE